MFACQRTSCTWPHALQQRKAKEVGGWRHQQKLLKVHHLVSIVLFACVFEYLLTLMVYWLDNNYKGSYNGFWIFISFLEVVKSVFSRVIVLLTALGQNITKHKISEKHMNRSIIINPKCIFNLIESKFLASTKSTSLSLYY